MDTRMMLSLVELRVVGMLESFYISKRMNELGDCEVNSRLNTKFNEHGGFWKPTIDALQTKYFIEIGAILDNSKGVASLYKIINALNKRAPRSVPNSLIERINSIKETYVIFRNTLFAHTDTKFDLHTNAFDDAEMHWTTVEADVSYLEYAFKALSVLNTTGACPAPEETEKTHFPYQLYLERVRSDTDSFLASYPASPFTSG